jgi:tetratricopeptide (TPR) repeat protein
MDVPRLAVQSTPEEWAVQGRALFRSKRYSQAVHSFERALLPREAAIAQAYYLREKARVLASGTRQKNAERAVAYDAAADAFVQCAKDAEKDAKAYYRAAGECYAQGGNDKRAAETYLAAEKFTEAAQYFRKGGFFDEAVEVVQQHRPSIDDHFAETLIDVARVIYLRDQVRTKSNCVFTALKVAYRT